MDGEGISAGIIVIKDSLNPYGKRVCAFFKIKKNYQMK
jgi:hypothetical protein